MTERFRTRAVLREIQAGHGSECAACLKQIVYRATNRAKKVIANIYDGPRWVATEQFHLECYDERYGPPDDRNLRGVYADNLAKEKTA